MFAALTKCRRGWPIVLATMLGMAALLFSLSTPAHAMPCQTCGDDGGDGGGAGSGSAPVSAIVAGPQTNDLGQGIHMTTTVRLSRNGRIDGYTETWTSWWGVGGHGSVGVLLLDANGNVIGAGNAHTFGVDAKSIFWSRSDRYDSWVDQVPPQIAAQTAKLQIVHTSAGVDNFQRDLDAAKQKGCAIFSFLKLPCPFG